MSRLVIAIFAVALSSVPAFAQTPELADVVVTAEARTRPALLVPMYAAQVVLQCLDLSTTFRALGDGHREANPVFKSGNKRAMIGAKMAAAGLNAYLVETMWKKKPKTAVLMMVAVNGLMSGIVANNARVLSGR